ncbi:MAG: YraN family protein [Eubacteriales bacterium]|nr:YraN family protein [Eubacteriales bacterium]MDD4475423.1 YraN family protein [Eubacteriales bacterium]
MNDTRKIGAIGEEAAENHLKNSKHLILVTNYQSGTGEFAGEIDIVAWKDDCLVFAEVKTRSSNLYGEPMDAVDIRKMKALVRTAAAFENDFVKNGRIFAYVPFLFFKLRKRLKIKDRRHDIIEVLLSRDGKIESIRQHENAFTAATPKRLEKYRKRERNRFRSN